MSLWTFRGTSSSGLSSGAKAGIAIGVVVGVILVALLLAFGLSRHSRKVRGWQKEALDQDFAYGNGHDSINTIEMQQGRGYFQ